MAKKTKPVEEASLLEDDLASVLADNLNKKFKSSNYKVAYFLEGDSDSPSDVTEWISTGSTMLDLAIANRPNGGLPVGRICEITGLEASGKSLLAAHALADTQKKGGLAVYIDTENAISREFLEAIGINLKDMLYVPLDTVEDIFESIETIVESVRKNAKNRLVTIVVDSVAGASTKQEMSSDYDKDGWATSKAIILSKAMRKITNFIGRERICLIFTNQLRTRLGVSFGDQWTTSGGKAIAFHSSVRLRLKSVGQIKLAKSSDAPEAVLGITTRAQVVKNRMGPPLRSVDYEIYFDSGIDDFGSWLTMLKNYSLVTQAGAWYTYTNSDTGEIIKFQSKDFQTKLIDDPEMKEQVYRTICEKYIINYKAGEHFGVDDIEIETEFEGEDS
jgi:recombination protein RecA